MPPSSSPPRRAAVTAAAAIALLTTMDAMVKLAAERLPVVQITFARFLFAAFVTLAVAAIARPGWPSREALQANGWRALLFAVTAVSFFHAITLLPLAEALALSFVAPILIAALAVPILGEVVEPRVAGALAAGFAGMAVIVWGSLGGETNPGALEGVAAALLSAFTYALAMVYLRARAQRDPATTIVVIQNVGPALLLVLPAALVWTAPTGVEWALLALIGLLGAAGHLLLVHAYARAAAARLAALDYTSLLWAGLLGAVLFGETPTWTTLAGAALIVAGAVYASRR